MPLLETALYSYMNPPEWCQNVFTSPGRGDQKKPRDFFGHTTPLTNYIPWKNILRRSLHLPHAAHASLMSLCDILHVHLSVKHPLMPSHISLQVALKGWFLIQVVQKIGDEPKQVISYFLCYSIHLRGWWEKVFIQLSAPYIQSVNALFSLIIPSHTVT